MKSIVLVIICFLTVFTGNATDPKSKKKILIVGFSNSYFNSNSFEAIAKGNHIDEDSIWSMINDRLLKTFTDELNPNFEYIQVENVKNVSSDAHTSFYYLLPVKQSDITSVQINEPDIRRLCAFYEADMIIFINSYELNWEEDPYVTYSHTFDSEVFTKSGKKIIAERISFMMDDVTLKAKYANKLLKQFSKVLRRLEKVETGNDALVNR